MDNNAGFTGLNLIEDGYKKDLATILLNNELGNSSNGYELVHADTSQSGWSFGVIKGSGDNDNFIKYFS